MNLKRKQCSISRTREVIETQKYICIFTLEKLIDDRRGTCQMRFVVMRIFENH